jgi:nuclear protein localization family protein 4
MRTVSNPKFFDDISLLDPVLNCDSWQTLMTFTRESARKLSPSPHHTSLIFTFSSTAVRPTSIPPGLGGSHIGDDIPPEIFDQIAAENEAAATSHGASGGDGISSSGRRICPHCTFENTHGENDCEVCGLPL